MTGEASGPKGPGPSQGKINNQGDAYLSKEFPELSKIVSAKSTMASGVAVARAHHARSNR